MHRFVAITLAAALALFLAGCCYKQSYGPSFEEELKASKGKNWYFGFNAAMKPIISAPLLLNDKLYVTSLGGVLYCVDKEKGKPVDTFIFNNKRPLKAGFRSGPVADGKNLFVGCYDHNVYAIDPSDGGVQWIYATSGKIEGSPVLMDGRIYVGTWTNELYCLDKATGDVLWEYKAGDKVRCTPAAFGGRVYFGDISGRFYCLSVTGSQPKLEWDFKAGDAIYGEPVTDGDAVWFTSIDKNIYCLDAKTGQQRWVYETGGEIWAGPCIDTFAVDLPNTAKPPTETPLPGAETNAPTDATKGNTEAEITRELVTRLYVGSMDAKFYILDAASGELPSYYDPASGKKETIQPFVCGLGRPNDDGIQGWAVTDEKNVYFGAGDFVFRALDKVTGKVVWNFSARGEIRSKPLVYEGKVVFGCDDTYFYGLKTESGNPVKGAM